MSSRQVFIPPDSHVFGPLRKIEWCGYSPVWERGGGDYKSKGSFKSKTRQEAAYEQMFGKCMFARWPVLAATGEKVTHVFRIVDE